MSVSSQIVNGFLPVTMELPDLSELPPLRPAILWTGAHLFHVGALSVAATGSGDRMYDWVQAFCMLVIAVAGTVLWSALDRKRANYVGLHKWFQLGMRFAVGSQFLLYGVTKLVPLQMPFPPLTKLVEPFGDFSPFSVLWYSIGASPAYEMFVGSAEVFGALLLFFPRTARLGALVCLADAIEVFALNMTYDVPVKLFSFHLIVMSLILLAPEMRRLMTFFFMETATPPSSHPKLFSTPRGNRIAFWVQAAFVLFLIIGNGTMARTNWHQYGGGAPKSPLYGIWNVEPSSPERQTWRRVIFEGPNLATFQRPDDSFVRFGSKIDLQAGTVALTKPADAKWGTNFHFERVGNDQLNLAGEMDGARLQLRLRLQDRNQLMLVSRGFHWISERPFGR